MFGSIAAVLVVALIVGGVYFVAKRLRRKGNNNTIAEKSSDPLMKMYSYETLKRATNNFSEANQIGRGGSGRVYRGTLDGEQIAVKILSSNCKATEFLKEMGLIFTLRHPNLVTIHGCSVKGEILMLVLEYMENKSLTHLLFHDRDLTVSWATRKSIVLGVARGLNYLHEGSPIKVIHRDIKTCNILLDAEMTPKISDFGLAEIIEGNGEGGRTRLSGTMGYIDPEIDRTGELTERADVFSFGVVVVEVLSRQRIVDFNRPNGETNLLYIVGRLKRDGRLNDVIDPEIGRHNLEEAAQLLKLALQCTRSKGSRRPTMAEVVQRLEDGDLPAQQRHPRSQPFNEIEEIYDDDDDDDD